MARARVSLKNLSMLGVFGFAVAGCSQQSPAALISGFTGERFAGGMHTFSKPVEVASTTSMKPVARKAVTDESAKVASKAHSYGSGEGSHMVEETLSAIEPAAGPRAANSRIAAVKSSSVSAVKAELPVAAPTAPQAVSEVIQHDVVATDTVFKLARTYNTTANQILADNGMKTAADIKVGQMLNITTNTKAQVSVLDDMKRVLNADVQTAHANQAVNDVAAATPVAERMREAVAQADKNLDAIEPAAGAAPAPKVDYVSHTVAPKETIYRISLKYGVSVLDIMAANDFSEPQDLKADAVIRVPMKQTTPHMVAGAKDAPRVAGIEPSAGTANKPVQVAMLRNVPLGIGGGQDDLDARAAKQDAAKAEILQAEVVPATSEAVAVKKVVEKVQDEVAAAEAQRGKIDPVASKASGMVWPVKGQVVRRFGDDGHGVARTGINISVPKGTPVLAADSGTVLYADNGLKIYGNLVLIRHSSGMVSAYAHNGYLLVKKGETVKKGQVVAVSGASGNVESPQLHFELRQHASAVDPMRVLPRL